MDEVKLSDIDGALADLSYPLTQSEAIDALGDLRLRYADGGEPARAVLERSTEDEFASPDELKTEIYSNLPTEAVGEPGQSEGEG